MEHQITFTKQVWYKLNNKKDGSCIIRCAVCNSELSTFHRKCPEGHPEAINALLELWSGGTRTLTWNHLFGGENNPDGKLGYKYDWSSKR